MAPPHDHRLVKHLPGHASNILALPFEATLPPPPEGMGVASIKGVVLLLPQHFRAPEAQAVGGSSQEEEFGR